MSKKATIVTMKGILLAGLALGSTAVFADNCVKATASGASSHTICVNVPVGLPSQKMVFNIDSQVTTDGTSGGHPVALEHMYKLGNANLARIKSTTLVKGAFHIKGVIHGPAISWALSDKWWQDHVPGAKGNPNKEWLNKIAELRNKQGMDIQLEACADTMASKGLTNADLYPGILVNESAVGRLGDLQQLGYTYIQETATKGPVRQSSVEAMVKADNS
jgi:intracellular sulfur oxidation DsrE/DsrF family protein